MKIRVAVNMLNAMKFTDNGTIAHTTVDVEIPTETLAKELEHRRHCNSCIRNGSTKCERCIWHAVFLLTCKGGLDMYKEAA